MDMVYNPHRTRLLRLAEKKGARAIPGMEMFLRQGMESQPSELAVAMTTFPPSLTSTRPFTSESGKEASLPAPFAIASSPNGSGRQTWAAIGGSSLPDFSP
jgi:hypothetical protein